MAGCDNSRLPDGGESVGMTDNQVNLFTGKKMSKSFHGRKRNKPGSYGSLFAY